MPIISEDDPDQIGLPDWKLRFACFLSFLRRSRAAFVYFSPWLSSSRTMLTAVQRNGVIEKIAIVYDTVE